MILDFNSFNEGVNDNYLYRFISINWFMELADMTNMPTGLKTFRDDFKSFDDYEFNDKFPNCNKKYFISFTRNKNFNYDIVKITFDKNKLKQNYKLMPIEYSNLLYRKNIRGTNNNTVESEERILFNDKTGIKNWLKYVIKIELVKDFIEIGLYKDYTKEEVLSKIEYLNNKINNKI